LYAFATLLLAAGTWWWVSTAPATGLGPQAAEWRASVERLLPDRSNQVAARTLMIRADGTAEETAVVRPGPYVLFVLCAGRGQVLIRLSSTGPDSGRLIPCTDHPDVESLSVGLADDFYLSISGEADVAAVFRWQLTRATR
jgi:hypothetical protein